MKFYKHIIEGTKKDIDLTFHHTFHLQNTVPEGWKNFRRHCLFEINWWQKSDTYNIKGSYYKTISISFIHIIRFLKGLFKNLISNQLGNKLISKNFKNGSKYFWFIVFVISVISKSHISCNLEKTKLHERNNELHRWWDSYVIH